ncbi:MAG: amidohydrolase family protein [Gemmatimonadota bacterium]|nr:amidohydrolase family protein [Gemmatimonadota bacterium]
MLSNNHRILPVVVRDSNLPHPIPSLMRPYFLLAAVVAGQPLLLTAQAPTLSPATRQFVSIEAPVVALTRVRVIDGTGAPAAAEQTIVMANGKITAVGKTGSTRVPAGARVVELTGHTVIPGLVGLHDHTFYTTSARSMQLNTSAPRLYLGSGVTTIRTTGSMSPYSEINLKRVIDKGEAAGPRMYITGPYLTGETGLGGMHQLLTPEAARRVVAYWGEEGVTWLKFYTTVSRAAMGAAIDEAHKRGIKVTGHLCSVSFREAVALGIDNLEHGLFVNTDYDPEKKPDMCPQGSMAKLGTLDMKSEPVSATFKEMIDKKVAMTSTLAVFELFVPNRPPLEQRVIDAMAPDVRTEYLTTRSQISENAGFGISPEVFKKALDFEYAFVKAGGLLAAGVDPTGNGGALPGFGDQRNFELLIEAGFTPIEAIQIMTSNGAKVLGAYDRFGSVTAGKLADLVVIRGDPSVKPADIRNVVTVFKDGVGYDAPKLIESVRGLVGIR